jgi:hypothetical protein
MPSSRITWWMDAFSFPVSTGHAACASSTIAGP